MRQVMFALLVLIVLLTVSLVAISVFQRYGAVYTPRTPRPFVRPAIEGAWDASLTRNV